MVDTIQGVGVFRHHSYRDERFWPKEFPIYFTKDKSIGDCEWVNEVIIEMLFSRQVHPHPQAMKRLITSYDWLLTPELKQATLDKLSI